MQESAEFNNFSKYHILTYGCQMNVRDSEIIAGLLEAMGYTATDTVENAGIIIFNTCSVRHSAENKVYGKLGEVMVLKRKKPGTLIAFGGCMAQLPEVRKKLKKSGVDVVFGTHNIHELPHLIEEARFQKQAVYRVWEQEGMVIEAMPSQRRPGLSAYINIMYGCNNFCSYCIVPYTRGRERSRQPEDIVKELEEVAALGYREVTLLGQNVNSYGYGLDKEIDFADLLKRASAVEGIDRIRFTTSHPKDMSDKLIDAVAILPKVCEHIHVPLQAGSNDVLRRMNRRYTREHYLELTHKIRQRIPGVAITSDLIVGFPGENEEDFLDTLDMVQKVRFEAAFTFIYSPRSGTRAASWEGQLELEEKKNRLQRLNQVQYQIAAEINQSMQGSIREVMVEGPSKTNPEKLTSRTRTNHIVIFSGPKDLIGQLINVRITEAKTFSLFGEVV
ncbi:MAG: tRNA (N6-isopentenyl adenosine(37)-C2)-methylthiotransferase MiaB [Syntrophomonadaceae bacterium]|nr:tRNA (N6-isopentenyl adenosine(37)-C2)-methylthiotransferase MiaB [Syntrophomonadaceae bacterium]